MKRWGAIIVASLLSGSAWAAGVPPQLPPQTPPQTPWSGWYAGANIGYGFGDNHIALDPLSPGAVNARSGFISHSLDSHLNGALGGIQAGRNWQTGRFVYGFESDLDYAGIRGSVAGPLLIPPFDFQTTQTQKLDWFGTLRARAGVAVSDRTLIFLTGGLAYG
jgi:outer membrane immunogenic protein